MKNEAGILAIVRGLVQGVSFRYFVLRNARALGLNGYVRNMVEEDSVEVLAEGDQAILEKLLGHINRGPTRADVQEVNVSWSNTSGMYENFQIIHHIPKRKHCDKSFSVI